jgi:hypothetical protein
LSGKKRLGGQEKAGWDEKNEIFFRKKLSQMGVNFHKTPLFANFFQF